jgi:hypothetical protein
MQGTTRHRPHTTPAGPAQHAVVWIETGRAIVARRTSGAADAVVETLTHEPGPLGIADVAHRVGQAAQVLVLGPDDVRLALEREIVAIGHHPERIREERLAGPMSQDAVLARLDRIAPARAR